MPPLTRWFIKAALVYLTLALCVGILLAIPNDISIAGLFLAYLHMLTFGWLTQLIFGVAFWMFPKFSSVKPRGYEPLNGISPSSFSGWMLVAAAILQWLSGITFVINTWPRVREK